MSKEVNVKAKIASMSVKDSDLGWQLVLRSKSGFGDVSPEYTVNIEVDQLIFDEKKEIISGRIAEIQKRPNMFDGGKEEIKDLKGELKDLDLEIEELEKLQIADFKAKVLAVEFVKGMLTLQVTDEVVVNLIKIRNNFNYFVVVLK